MKKLSEKDLAILAARGFKNGLSTVTDFEIPSSVKKAEKPKKHKAEKPKHEFVGKLLHTSWGYDMTINDFCKILEVSPTGKTVKCQMVTRNVSGAPWCPGGNGKASAGNKCYGPVFRLKVDKWNDGVSFHGSYPYCIGDDKEEWKKWKAYMGRKGYFSMCSENEKFYENRCD